MRDNIQLSWRRAPLALALGLILAGCSDSGGSDRLTAPAAPTAPDEPGGIGAPTTPTPLPPEITEGTKIGADADPANILTNGSFEAGVNVGGWRIRGDDVKLSIAADTFTGVSALLVEGRADTWQGVGAGLPKLLPGRTYVVSARIKLAGNSSAAEPPLAKFMVTPPIPTGSGAQPIFITAATGAVDAENWTHLTGTFTALNTGDGTEYEMYFDIDDPEVSYIVDDILIKPAFTTGANVTPNLAINGGAEIEDIGSGWFASGAAELTRTDSIAYSGSHSIRVSERSQPWEAASARMGAITVAGQYVVSMAVRLPAGASNSDAQLTLQRPGATPQYVQLATGTATADGWTVLRGITEYSGDTKDATVYVELADASTDYFVDALQITQLTGDRNLIVSGNAEASISDWTRMGDNTVSVVRSPDAAFRGNHGVSVSGRSANWHGAAINLAALPKDNLYNLSVMMKMAPGAPQAMGKLTVKLVQDGNEDEAIYAQIGQLQPADSENWVELSGSFEFVPTGTVTQFIAYIEADNANASFYVDEFTVTVADDNAPIFTYPTPEPSTSGGLAGGSSKYLGSAVQSEVPDDFTQYWNQVTPENAGKWAEVEEVQDVMDWAALDASYAYAKANQMPFKLHTLVWGSQFPEWIAARDDEGQFVLDNEEQKAQVEEWIAALAARYPETDSIDVVNEALKANAQPPFKDALGGAGTSGYDWVVWAFERARHYFPKAQLLINDYGIVNDQNERARYKALVEVLLARNLVDGIGLQGHYFNMDALTGGALKTALDDVAALGLPIYISELDLSGAIGEAASVPGSAEEALQAERYQTLFPVLWEHPSVAGVTVWNYVWGETWRHERVDGVGGVFTALTDVNGNPRAALDWLRDYFSQESAQ